MQRTKIESLQKQLHKLQDDRDGWIQIFNENCAKIAEQATSIDVLRGERDYWRREDDRKRGIIAELEAEKADQTKRIETLEVALIDALAKRITLDVLCPEGGCPVSKIHRAEAREQFQKEGIL